MSDPINDPFYTRFYRIFCWLAESNVELHPAQAVFIIEETYRMMGTPSTSKNLALNGEKVSFRELLGLLENLVPDRKLLEAAAEGVFDRYISQVIRKGFILYRRGGSSRGCIPGVGGVRKWQTAWYSLAPGIIHVLPVRNGRLGARQTKLLEKDSIIESCGMEGSIYYMEVRTSKGIIQLGCGDELSCRTLCSDISLSIACPTREDLCVHDRRMALRFKRAESEIEAERRLKLEKEKEKLEQQLQEERRALKDEEIVRGLATRMLEEERLKSEQMERVLQELQSRLHDRLEPETEQDEDASYAYGEDDVTEMHTYANELDSSVDYIAEVVDLPESEKDEAVWKKDDFLIISTQSI